MSILSRFWDRYGRFVLKYAALELLDELSRRWQDGKLTSIDDAKRLLCDEIQSKHRVPGELRRWACAAVNGVEANDLVAWLPKVRASVKRW